MSWLPPIPWSVLRARCFPPIQGRVLFALWSRCDSEGNCFPAFPMLCADAGDCDKRSAIAAVAALEAAGVITVDRAHGKVHRYHLDPAAIEEYVEAKETGYKNVPSSTRDKNAISDKNVSRVGTKMLPELGTFLHELGTKMSPEVEPEVEPIKKIQLSRTKREGAPDQKPAAQKKVTPKVKPAPAVTPEFIEEMVALHRGVFTAETVREIIAQALDHTAARKYTHHDLYVKGWLRKEAERRPAQQQQGGYRNGNGPGTTAGQRQSPNGPGQGALAPVSPFAAFT